MHAIYTFDRSICTGSEPVLASTMHALAYCPRTMNVWQIRLCRDQVLVKTTAAEDCGATIWNWIPTSTLE